MKDKEFNEQIWRCNDEREKNMSNLSNILIMQEILKRSQGKMSEKDLSTFILCLGQLTKSVIKDAQKNEELSDFLLESEGFGRETQETQKELLEGQIEDVAQGFNELSRLRNVLKK